MFVPVSAEDNRENLKYIANFLAKNKIPYFIFFGTLLGITRDNDVIKDDDDVDIYINLKDRKRVISVINETDFKIDYNSDQNKSKFFLQLTKRINKKNISYVELYFYDELDEHIVDRWNFRGIGNKKSASIYIPKKILFPIKEINFRGNLICVPFDEKAVCEFLYGKKWIVPLTKRKDYKTVILMGKPYQLSGLFGNLVYQIEYKYRNLLNYLKR